MIIFYIFIILLYVNYYFFIGVMHLYFNIFNLNDSRIDVYFNPTDWHLKQEFYYFAFKWRCGGCVWGVMLYEFRDVFCRFKSVKYQSGFIFKYLKFYGFI